MSSTNIPDQMRRQLWAQAAGRCEYDNCSVKLWLDTLTKAEFNVSYIAHIIAEKPDGPRGDAVLSEQLKSDITNLMLMCDAHHRRIDVADVTGHTVERLRAMKRAHEERIDLACSILPEKRTEIVLYGANIGDHSSPLTYQKATKAIFPDWYPARSAGIELGMQNSAILDRDPEFWKNEERQLRRKFADQVQSRLVDNKIEHLSVFGIAPQPLLMLLGFLVSDLRIAEVYQLHREPPGWAWQEQDSGADMDYELELPTQQGSEVALVFSLSATILEHRITDVLGPEVAIWRATISTPNNDFLHARRELASFRAFARSLMNQIKATHPHAKILHVFPAMPVATAIEFGRVFMPKADLPLRIYDEQQGKGFVRALDIGMSSGDKV